MIPYFSKFSHYYLKLLLNIILVFALLGIILINLFFSNTIPLGIFKIISIIAVIPVIIDSIKSLSKGEVSTDSLAAVALVFSFLAKEWYSAAFINLMLSSARIFDIWTQKKSEDLLNGLLKLRPDSVKVQVDGNVELKKIADVGINDLILVNPGDRIPIDGVVESGQASIDESTLTGESFPITKVKGDLVYSPTLNTSGEIIVRVTKTTEESTLTKIIQLVENASIKKSKIVRMADKFTKWYILATLIGSILAYIFTGNLLFVLSVLLVVCADDIAVSIPLAFSVAIVKASEKGILIKSAEVLEKISNINTFITDKTGTLTTGKLNIVDIITFSDVSKKDCLKYIASAESRSSHPIAAPILAYVKGIDIKIISPDKSNESPGEGIVANVGGKKIVVGKVDFLKSKGVTISKEEEAKINDLDKSGFSIVALAINKKMSGLIAFEDTLRISANTIVQKTKSLGAKKWIMLTGDNELIAQKIAKKVGIDEVKSNLTPSQKLEFIEKTKLTLGQKNLAMIGDGVNDAASLALADVGIAMGTVGSDAAINAADISLMTDNLDKIPEAMILGAETKRIVIRIFMIWATTNLIGLILVFTKVLNPTGAATYNFLTDFLPIILALRVGVKK